ncbi:MAG: sugar transferase [Candidatus Latescibacterota bacterium]|nr:sugar transferase [Candidatus Latescibacterota bacterium]
MSKRLLLKPILAVVDFSILTGTFLLAYWLRFQLEFLPEVPVPSFELYFRFSFFVGVLGFAMLYSSGMYRLRRLSFGVEDFFGILRAVTFSALIIMVMNFIFRGYITSYDVETYSRLIILFSWLLSVVLLCLWRFSTAQVFKQFRTQGIGLRDVVIIGTDQTARSFCRAIQQNVDFGYRPLGFLSNGITPSADEVEGLPIMGAVDELSAIFRRETVNEVVLTCMDMEMEQVAHVIKACERADVQFSMIPGFFEILTRQMNVQEVADIPIFQLEERIFQRWGRLVKRGIDIAVAMLVLLVFAPLWVFAALGIVLESKGGVIFKHDRVGKGEKIFSMWKFRSMYADAEQHRGEMENLHGSADALLRVPDDVRVTRVGRLLRRFSIDEIPQIYNVLKGDMSLVGPRPHMPSEVAQYKDWQRRKFDVLPGMTGLTQVRGRKALSLDEMVRLDIYYIENWSPIFDLQILVKTIPAVFLGKGAY